MERLNYSLSTPCRHPYAMHTHTHTHKARRHPGNRLSSILVNVATSITKRNPCDINSAPGEKSVSGGASQALAVDDGGCNVAGSTQLTPSNGITAKELNQYPSDSLRLLSAITFQAVQTLARHRAVPLHSCATCWVEEQFLTLCLVCVSCESRLLSPAGSQLLPRLTCETPCVRPSFHWEECLLGSRRVTLHCST
ncbi:hypothetical protein CEXT_75381 [Caerostris extrusa]|uniref:Uncharacterized protein n=1 Tax=Caerostris extrusa TaxID=172846 RepID=A0AAV4W2H1_CAEEX|nr:hypothetical protein CEXT_75381 [Caerostris extrusa]